MRRADGGLGGKKIFFSNAFAASCSAGVSHCIRLCGTESISAFVTALCSRQACSLRSYRVDNSASSTASLYCARTSSVNSRKSLLLVNELRLQTSAVIEFFAASGSLDAHFGNGLCIAWEHAFRVLPGL